MALEAAFQELVAQLGTLRDSLMGLRVTVVEDRPLVGGVILADTLGDSVEDLLGWLEEALEGAVEGQQAVGHPTDVDRARRSLTACQEQYNRIAHRFSSELISYERMEQLTSLGHQRGRGWLAWTDSVKEALDRCQQPLYDTNQALFFCWREIAERAGMTSVSVQAIGQQISLREGEQEAQEGMT